LVLRRTNQGRDSQSVSCTVTIELDNDDIFSIRTTGDHPCAAINRAMELLGHPIHQQGTLRVVRQPAPESLSAGWTERLRGLIESLSS
jgi:hypothetical protein